jgi:hypothetical protein
MFATTSPREFLTDSGGPTIDGPLDALRLLAALVNEPAARSAHDRAGQLRRRAYVWTRAAALWPEFEAPAARSVADWQAAESEAVSEAVGLARGR